MAFSVIESPLIDKYVDFKPTSEERLWLRDYSGSTEWIVGILELRKSEYYSKYLSMAERCCYENGWTFENLSSLILVTKETYPIIEPWFL